MEQTESRNSSFLIKLRLDKITIGEESLIVYIFGMCFGGHIWLLQGLCVLCFTPHHHHHPQLVQNSLKTNWRILGAGEPCTWCLIVRPVRRI